MWILCPSSFTITLFSSPTSLVRSITWLSMYFIFIIALIFIKGLLPIDRECEFHNQHFDLSSAIIVVVYKYSPSTSNSNSFLFQKRITVFHQFVFIFSNFFKFYLPSYFLRQCFFSRIDCLRS